MGYEGFDFNLFMQPGEQSRYLDLFNQFVGQFPSYTNNYLDVNDPDYQKYTELATAPTGSEDLIRDYIGKAPSYEDYNPSTGRKIASFLLGTLSGGGYNAAQKHLYAPFEREVEDWSREGKNIATRANLIDRDRNRQLTSLKFTLQQKAAEKRARASEALRQQQEARRSAAEVADEEVRDEAMDFRRTQAGILNNQRELLREMAVAREERAAEANERAREAAELRQEEAANKENTRRLREQAVLKGMDIYGYEDEEIAVWLAKKLAQENPNFSGLFNEEGNYVEGLDPSQIESARSYIQELIRRFRRGEGF